MNKFFIKSFRRFSILHSKPKINKIDIKQTQQVNTKICYINYEIKFNENGLYLLAENPNKSNHLTENFILTVSLSLMLADLRTIVFIFLFYLLKQTSLHTFKKNIVGEISEIYLTKEMDRILIRYKNSRLYKLCHIKNIKLLDEKEFNSDPSNKTNVKVKIDGKTRTISSDFIIHNRELFCAVFNEYEIRHVDKPGYIKLKTDDSSNYNV